MNAILQIQTEKKSHVVVVEDHPVLCDGLKQLINNQPDLACVGVAADISDAKQLIEECKPDLMILDLRLKAGDALDFIKTLRVECPEVKVLVLSQYDELVFAERTMKCCERCAKSWRANYTLAKESPRPWCSGSSGRNRLPRVTASSACPIAKCKCFNFWALHTARGRLPSNFTLAGKPSRPTAKKSSIS